MSPAQTEAALLFVSLFTTWTALRTGPGNAPDGKPKFDLSRLDPAFFELLRQRVQML